MSTCRRKHTKYQPDDDDWKCPKCGVGAEHKGENGLINDGNDLFEDYSDCPLLHDDDVLNCYQCSYGITGKTFAAKVARERNLVKCPHCKGTGLVPKTKAQLE